MYEIFAELLKKNSVTKYQVSKATGVSQSSLSDWSRGKSQPKYASMQKIADYFNVTVDYLLTGEQKEKPAQQDGLTFDDFTYALHNESAQLTEENKEKLLDMARMLKLAQEAQKHK